MPPIFDPAFRNDALNLIIAVLLGGAIGFERQWRQRLAGLRTNTLVSLGAAIFVVFESQFTDTSPTRVAAQVVTGIGFLGAGVIWKEGVNVRGLNTAATLWCSCAVGLLAGAGHWSRAILAAGLVAGVNLVLRPLVRLINRQPLETAEIETSYIVTVTCRANRGGANPRASGARFWGQRSASARARKHRYRRHRPGRRECHAHLGKAARDRARIYRRAPEPGAERDGRALADGEYDRLTPAAPTWQPAARLGRTFRLRRDKLMPRVLPAFGGVRIPNDISIAVGPAPAWPPSGSPSFLGGNEKRSDD